MAESEFDPEVISRRIRKDENRLFGCAAVGCLGAVLVILAFLTPLVIKLWKWAVN